MVINNILPKWYLGEVQTVYKTKENKSSIVQVKNSQDSNKYIRSNFNINWEDREYAGIIGLNKNNKIIYHELISMGGIDMTVIDCKIIYSSLLKYRCSAFIIFHNHPSGNLKASNIDQNITNKLKENSKLLDINLLDHMIITSEGYLSMADEGLL